MNSKNITHFKKILYNIDIIDFISANQSKDLSIIYFTNHSDAKIQKLSSYTKDIIFITKTPPPFKCLSIKYINNKIFKHLSDNVIIAIDIDENVSFKYMKYLINNLRKLFGILKKHKINFDFTSDTSNISAILSCSSTTPYFEDIYTTFKALSTNSKKEQYEIIYDYACTYLDNEFYSKNICGFHNDVCDACRAGLTKYKINGCCYTIDYGAGGIIKEHKPCKYLVNRNCVANCISCKLHTCYYLKTKNIEFKIKDILLLNCFFSYKQWFVLKYNIFRTKEEIIKKLLQVKYIPGIFYYPLSLYKIH